MTTQLSNRARNEKESVSDYIGRRGLDFTTEIIPAVWRDPKSGEVNELPGRGVIMGRQGESSFILGADKTVSVDGSVYKAIQPKSIIETVADVAERSNAMLNQAFMHDGVVHAIFDRENENAVKEVGSAMKDRLHLKLGLVAGVGTSITAMSMILACTNGMMNRSKQFAHSFRSNTPNLQEKLTGLTNVAAKLDDMRAFNIETADMLQGVEVNQDFVLAFSKQYGPLIDQFLTAYENAPAAAPGSLWGVLQAHTRINSVNAVRRQANRGADKIDAAIVHSLAGDVAGVAKAGNTSDIIDMFRSWAETPAKAKKEIKAYTTRIEKAQEKNTKGSDVSSFDSILA